MPDWARTLPADRAAVVERVANLMRRDKANLCALEILEALRRRDHLDATRAVAPLRIADDARIITTDGNTFEDTVAAVVGAIRDAEARRA